MAAVDLLVTHGAVLKRGQTQIVKRRRHNSCHFRRRVRKIDVALQANEPNVRPRQHPWIRRAMRLVTCLAAFKAHWRMLESEWTPFVAVAAEASRLVGREGLKDRGPNAAMRIVAIYAAHVAFRKFVMERPLELGQDVYVAASALRVNCFGLARHQRVAGMDFVAGGAGNLVLGVAALDPPDVRGLIQMASETDFVGGGSR